MSKMRLNIRRIWSRLATRWMIGKALKKSTRMRITKMIHVLVCKITVQPTPSSQSCLSLMMLEKSSRPIILIFHGLILKKKMDLRMRSLRRMKAPSIWEKNKGKKKLEEWLNWLSRIGRNVLMIPRPVVIMIMMETMVSLSKLRKRDKNKSTSISKHLKKMNKKLKRKMKIKLWKPR